MSQDPLQFIVGGIIISTYTTKHMTKTTLSEETQELLDEVYDVELALEFIENHGETEYAG